jgi:hypothetical protein
MEGFKTYRHEQNPEEKRFHDNFIADICHDDMQSAIIFEPKDGGLAPSELLTPRENKIVISAMQWLGSPVGQSFLREMGYEKQPEVPKVVMTDKDRSYIAKRCRRQQRGSVWSWKELSKVRQNGYLNTECEALGFTLENFYATDGKFINKILKR